MQKLVERSESNTPRGIPHAPGNCGLALNSSKRVRNSVSGSKTSTNNSDAALTAIRQAGQNSRVSVVYVLNMRGEALMPCCPREARKLLEAGRAKVAKRTPFTIQLIQPSGEVTQPIILGVDSGFTYVGLSAVSSKQELFTAEVTLRSDMVKLNSERSQYRRARRNRKTWYRQPRFLNRKKGDGWLAPSIQHKLDSHFKVIKMVRSILPVTHIIIEVAAFDIQKIKNPDIQGVGYQNGEQVNFWNVREYVLYRDGHTCRYCKGKSGSKILEVHHIVTHQTGGDRPDNLVTLCDVCHGGVSQGVIKPTFKLSMGFRAETFMSMVRWRLVNTLQETFNHVGYIYGYSTKSKRIAQGLEKNHINDAFVIADGNCQARQMEQFHIKQVRKCNRKLYKGNHSHIKNTAPRFVKGFQRYDKVRYRGQECFVFGRRTRGYFDLRILDGSKVSSCANAKECGLLESARTLLVSRRGAILSDINDRGLNATMED